MSQTEEVKAPSKPVLWSLPLYRVPSGKPKAAMVIALNYFGYNTHYYDERTWSCQGSECLLCDMGVQSRWAGSTVIANLKGCNHHLLVFTRPVATIFDAAIERHQSLDGCQFLFGRQGLTSRSQMFAEYLDWERPPERVYTKGEIRELVNRIFGFRKQLTSPSQSPMGDHQRQ